MHIIILICFFAILLDFHFVNRGILILFEHADLLSQIPRTNSSELEHADLLSQIPHPTSTEIELCMVKCNKPT